MRKRRLSGRLISGLGGQAAGVVKQTLDRMTSVPGVIEGRWLPRLMR
jgi:hypothetical protein